MLCDISSVAVLLPIVIDYFKRAQYRRFEVQHTAKNCIPGRPFTRGADPRRNTLGRPKNFDAFRKLCQKICHEKVTHDGEVMTRLEVILRDWAGSKDPQKQIALVQYGFGKPVDRIETTGLENRPILRLHFAHEEPGCFDKHPDMRPTGGGKILWDTAPNGEGTRRPCYLTPTSGFSKRLCCAESKEAESRPV